MTTHIASCSEYLTATYNILFLLLRSDLVGENVWPHCRVLIRFSDTSFIGFLFWTTLYDCSVAVHKTPSVPGEI